MTQGVEDADISIDEALSLYAALSRVADVISDAKDEAHYL